MTMNMTLFHEAKSFVHQQLINMVDLRRMSMDEIKSNNLKNRFIEMIPMCLSKQDAFKPLINNLKFVNEVIDEMLGFGPLEQLLQDDQVTEIMVNGFDTIYIEKKGEVFKTELQFVSEQSLRNIIGRIVAPLGRRIDESSPMVDARLPDGSRLNAIIPPLALNGSTVTIRKFSKKPILIPELIENKSIDLKAAGFLKMCVEKRKNILVAGGTGSGKTTLLNALSSLISHKHRIITIEDAAELKLHQEHVISLEARPCNTEGKGQITIRDLLKNALRMRPDRIIVGECRSAEALDMLQAMNTGHDGSMTTLHSNSSRDALTRLETMVLMAGYDLPLKAIRDQIASAVEIIVYLSRLPNGQRVVLDISEISAKENDVILLHKLFEYSPETKSLEFKKRMPYSFLNHEQEIREVLF